MRCTIAELLSAFAAATAVFILPSDALAQRGQKLDGAYVAHGTKCQDVFIIGKNGPLFGKNRNAFASAVLIRGKSISTPIATCRFGHVVRNGDVLNLELNCSNTVSYAPVKAYLRKNEDGSITRFNSPNDTTGDKYEICSP